MLDQGTRDKALAYLDREEHVKLLRSLVDIPSAPGEEEDVAKFAANWFSENGIKSFLQYAAPRRPNAVGLLRGTGGGRTLIFNGHSDVALTDPAEIKMVGGDSLPRYLKLPSYVEGNYVCGLGSNNDKGPVSAFMMAARALSRSGAKLKGDVFFTFVCGEIERAPVDEYQGPQYLGAGLGTRHLLGNGIRGDYALVCEPSNFAISGTLAGAIYLKISAFGETHYIPELRPRSEKNPISESSIENMTKVIDALISWIERYEVEGKYEFKDGAIVPKMNIGAIASGLPYKPNYSTAKCSIYVDVRIPPNREPLEVKKQIESHLGKLNMRVDVEMFRSHRGYEAKNVEPLTQTITQTYEELAHAKNPPNTALLSSRWNDVNAFNEVGIPAVKCGPGTGDGKMNIDEIVKAAKLYTLVALKMCG